MRKNIGQRKIEQKLFSFYFEFPILSQLRLRKPIGQIDFPTDHANRITDSKYFMLLELFC